MHPSVHRLFATLPMVVLLGAAPAAAVEAPLSRASFERALQEGRSCKRLEDVGPYVVVSKATDSVMTTIVDNLLQYYLSDSIDDSYVTVRLTTPFTRVRRKACEQKLLGDPIDQEALWNEVRASSMVSLWVETRSVVEDNTWQAREALELYGTPVDITQTAGPRVESVALRRGKSHDAPVVRSVPGAGVEYDFPATALQGRGPFYALIHTESPSLDLVMKLKRSALKEP